MARRQPKRRGSGKSKKPGLFKQATVRAQMRMAGSWPLYECLITEDWREEGQIIQIGVVRRAPQGEMAVGGKDGKPFFFAGPYDDVERIRRTLDRKVGPGNYYHLVPLGDPMMFGDDEYDEIEFEDWEDDED
jgi:hypothetical protein